MADAKINTKLKNRTEGGKKAVRQALRRRVFNIRRAKAVKVAVKGVFLAVEAKSPEAVSKIPVAYQAIDKAVKRGILKKNTAARMKSRVARNVAKIA